MGSALAVPLADNGHDVRLVGTHLDREIIDALRSTGVHPGLGRELPRRRCRPFQLEELVERLPGCRGRPQRRELVRRPLGRRAVSRSSCGPVSSCVADRQGHRRGRAGQPAHPAGGAAPSPSAPTIREQRPRGPRSSARRSPARSPPGASPASSSAARTQPRSTGSPRCSGPAGTTSGPSTDFVGGEVCAAAKNCYALSIGLAAGELERPRGGGQPRPRPTTTRRRCSRRAPPRCAQWIDAARGATPDTPDVASRASATCYVTSTGGRNVRVGGLLGAGLGFSEAAERLGNPTLEGAAAIKVFGAALVQADGARHRRAGRTSRSCATSTR